MNRQDVVDLIAMCAREVIACGLDTPAGRRAEELGLKLETTLARHDAHQSMELQMLGGAQ